MLAFGSMLARGLILSYDPTATAIASVTKVEIAPTGRQHLQWALRDWVYLEAMTEITPLYDHGAAEKIRGAIAVDLAHLRRKAISTFLNYLLQEDASFCIVPKANIYKTQETIRANLEQQVVALSSVSALAQTSRYHRSMGKISTWKKDNGYGFIKQANGAADAFINISDVVGTKPEFLNEGANVEYDVVVQERGPRAMNVVILS